MKYTYLQGFGAQGRMVETMGLTPYAMQFKSKDKAVRSAQAVNGTVLHYVVVEQDRLYADSAMEAAERLFFYHNKDDRPRGSEIRSMSVGDVLVLETDTGSKLVVTVLFCSSLGWIELDGTAAMDLMDAAERRAYTTVPSANVFSALVDAAVAERGPTITS